MTRGENVHVVFGSGQVGSHLAESLVRSGANVRVVKRTNVGIPGGVEPVLGDATDLYVVSFSDTTLQQN